MITGPDLEDTHIEYVTGRNAKTIRRISNDGDSGFLWFLETSYGYIVPRGFREHLSFAVRFPAAWLGFRKSMKTDII